MIVAWKEEAAKTGCLCGLDFGDDCGKEAGAAAYG